MLFYNWIPSAETGATTNPKIRHETNLSTGEH